MSRPPKVFITTSRFPSPPLIKFVKNLCFIFPNSKKLNRGGKFLPSLVSFCLFCKATDILLVYENRGKPITLVLVHLPFGPSIFFGLSNISSEIEKKNQIENFLSPHVILDNLDSDLGRRFAKIFTSLFPPPHPKSKRVISLSGRGKTIIFNHHWFEGGGVIVKNLRLHNLGPSFNMHPFRILLGILGEFKEEVEWTLTPFIGNFKKKKFF
jgi:U3 small nucleolar ribonucleoprotein protein IMP4